MFSGLNSSAVSRVNVITMNEGSWGFMITMVKILKLRLLNQLDVLTWRGLMEIREMIFIQTIFR